MKKERQRQVFHSLTPLFLFLCLPSISPSQRVEEVQYEDAPENSGAYNLAHGYRLGYYCPTHCRCSYTYWCTHIFYITSLIIYIFNIFKTFGFYLFLNYVLFNPLHQIFTKDHHITLQFIKSEAITILKVVILAMCYETCFSHRIPLFKTVGFQIYSVLCDKDHFSWCRFDWHCHFFGFQG